MILSELMPDKWNIGHNHRIFEPYRQAAGVIVARPIRENELLRPSPIDDMASLPGTSDHDYSRVAVDMISSRESLGDRAALCSESKNSE